jgi:hypothetical protein
MAALFNKWLLISIMPACFYINGMMFSLQSTVNTQQSAIKGQQSLRSSRNFVLLTSHLPLHPFHVSVTEINHNAADKTLEVTCKIFRDDFEKILIQNYKTKVDLINPTDRAAMEKLVNDYVQKHLSIKGDGKLLQFTGLGYEREDDAVYSYFQVNNINSVKKIELTNTILHDLFDDQLSIMHVTVGGNRKSGKLNYPAKQTSFEF